MCIGPISRQCFPTAKRAFVLLRIRLPLAAAASLALGAMLVGCGGGGPEQVVKQYFNGIANGDGEGVCEVLAVEAERDLEGPSCPEVIEQDFTNSLSEEGKDSFRNAEVSIEQDGDSARAASTLIDGNILLERRDGEWLITDLSDAS